MELPKIEQMMNGFCVSSFFQFCAFEFERLTPTKHSPTRNACGPRNRGCSRREKSERLSEFGICGTTENSNRKSLISAIHVQAYARGCSPRKQVTCLYAVQFIGALQEAFSETGHAVRKMRLRPGAVDFHRLPDRIHVHHPPAPKTR